MSDDTKPRITSFAFSKEFFNDPTFSSFLFDNKDLMNFDFDKSENSQSNSGNSQGSEQNPVSPINTSSYEGQTIFGSHRRYSNKNGVTTYHLNSPLSSPENNHINKEPSNEVNDTANYYNIINVIKRENINNINNNKNAGIFNPTSSFATSNSPPISPLPYNINNQKFYKNTQQSYSAVELTKPDHLVDDQKSSKSVKDYSMSGSANAPYSTKRRSKSLHNVSQSYDEDSFEYINDSITEYSFTQKDSYEPSEVTNASDKDKKGHTRSLSKTLKRAVSRNSRKVKKNHRKDISFSLKSKEKVPEVPPIPQEYNDNTLVFKPASGAIASYGDVTSNDNGFDFDSMISSDQTRKISLTPNRMNEIQKHQQSSANRLKPKNYERENLVPMNVMNTTMGRNNHNAMDNVNLNIMDYDSDDSIDRLLNEGKPKRKQETLWEFLKNSSPEDFMGKGSKADALTGNNSNSAPAKPVNNGPQPKYIPIEIKYSPFDNVDNNKSNTTDVNNNKMTYNSVNNNNLNFNSVNNNNINFNNMNYNNAKMSHVQTLPYHKKSLNENKSAFSSATLPISKRSTSRKDATEEVTSPSAQSMKLAQTISNIAKTPDSSSAEDDCSNASLHPPAVQTEDKAQQTVPSKPEMVSVGTQWYMSDAFLMRKKKVLFRPVDRRNPIAKYMFNHAFIETIYVSTEDIKKRRAHVQELVPQDFLARNFYYYSRYPSSIPPMPKSSEMVSKGTETDDMEPEVINHSVEVINDYIDEAGSLNNEDKTEINDETTLTTNGKKDDMAREVQTLYPQQERNEIVDTLYKKIIHYLETNPEKQKENNKTQEFAKLMFNENTKLQKELTKLRSELSAERVLRETAEEELNRYRSLMQSTLLNDN